MTESPQIQLAKKSLARAFEISATPPKGPFRTDNCWKFVPPENEDEKAGNRIDHIFLTPGTKVTDYETFGDFYGDNFYPSDHFPVKALIELPLLRVQCKFDTICPINLVRRLD